MLVGLHVRLGLPLRRALCHGHNSGLHSIGPNVPKHPIDDRSCLQEIVVLLGQSTPLAPGEGRRISALTGQQPGACYICGRAPVLPAAIQNKITRL